MELTMDVSTDCDWSFDRLHIALLYEDLLHLFTKNSEVSFR